MDKLTGTDTRAVLITAIIVCGVILFTLVNAMVAWVNKQHEWRMAMINKVPVFTEETTEGEAMVPHPSIPGAYLKLEGFATPEVREDTRPRPRPIKDNPQA